MSSQPRNRSKVFPDVRARFTTESTISPSGDQHQHQHRFDTEAASPSSPVRGGGHTTSNNSDYCSAPCGINQLVKSGTESEKEKKMDLGSTTVAEKNKAARKLLNFLNIIDRHSERSTAVWYYREGDRLDETVAGLRDTFPDGKFPRRAEEAWLTMRVAMLSFRLKRSPRDCSEFYLHMQTLQVWLRKKFRLDGSSPPWLIVLLDPDVNNVVLNNCEFTVKSLPIRQALLYLWKKKRFSIERAISYRSLQDSVPDLPVPQKTFARQLVTLDLPIRQLFGSKKGRGYWLRRPPLADNSSEEPVMRR